MFGPVQIDQDVAIHIPPSEDVLQCHIVGQVEAGRVLDIDSFNDVEFRNTIVNAVVSASFLLGDEFIHGSIVASTRKCGDGALRIEEPGETAGPAVVFREIIDHRHVFEAARSQQCRSPDGNRSEEHTSELQSLMRISYAVFCLKKQKQTYL